VHPTRVRVLEQMAQEPDRRWSPARLSAALSVPLGNLAYHVKELERLGLIEQVGSQQRRGALEHFLGAHGPGENLPCGEPNGGIHQPGTLQPLLPDPVRALAQRVPRGRAVARCGRVGPQEPR
jgi:Helix-turn-helix domain